MNMKIFCSIVVLLMCFESGLSQFEFNLSPDPPESDPTKLRRNMQVLSGSWRVYKLTLGSDEDRFNGTLGQNNLVDFAYGTYDIGNGAKGRLYFKMYNPRTKKFDDMHQAWFDGERFILSAPVGQGLIEYELVAYEDRTYMALQHWDKKLAKDQKVLGYIWVYGEVTLGEEQVLKLKQSLEERYVKSAPA